MIDRDIDVLARTIYGEARGESDLGRQAVGWTIMNRVKKGGWWGDDVIGVCLRAKQFSCWNDDDPNRVALMAASLLDEAFAACLATAILIFFERVPDPTGGATHYHTHAAAPAWAKGKQDFVSIGSHRFYKDID